MSITDADDEAKASNVVQIIRSKSPRRSPPRFKVPGEVRAFHDAFYKRGEELRARFGQWDCCDPVAHALLDLVQAQNNVAQAISDEVDYGVPNVVKSTMDARAEAAVKIDPRGNCHHRLARTVGGAGPVPLSRRRRL